MFATLAFAITLLGVFSIFELLKGNQKISLLKLTSVKIMLELIINKAIACCSPRRPLAPVINEYLP